VIKRKRHISVLFLTKDKLKTIQRCFHSLEYMHNNQDILEWLILDNDSKNPEVKDWLKSNFKNKPKVKLFFADHNLGVAGGRNLLMHKAQGDTFLILDSDVRDDRKAFLPEMLKYLDKPEIGIVGLHASILRKDWTWTESLPITYTGFCDSVAGFCQLFKRSILEQGCRIDLNYNPYWLEDADFCMQVRHLTKLRPYSIGMYGRGLYHRWSRTCAGTDIDSQKRWQYFKNKWYDIWLENNYEKT
jgi:GT2 family glycosyltransferase